MSLYELLARVTCGVSVMREEAIIAFGFGLRTRATSVRSNISFSPVYTEGEEHARLESLWIERILLGICRVKRFSRDRCGVRGPEGRNLGLFSSK